MDGIRRIITIIITLQLIITVPELELVFSANLSPRLFFTVQTFAKKKQKQSRDIIIFLVPAI